MKSFLAPLILTTIFIMTGSLCGSAQMIYGTVTISDTTQSNLTPISPLMNGCFIEYIDDDINGVHALAAQELFNRGFDIKGSEGLPKQWKSWKTTDANGQYDLKLGGYNKQGNYYQEINNKSTGKLGIAHDVQIQSNIGSVCYIYCRSDNYSGEIYAALVSPDGQEIYSSIPIGNCTQEWQKKTAKFPVIKEIYQAQLVFYTDSIGTVELDEASFLQDDSFSQVRREHLDLYKAWKPTAIRFLGGCFSDQPVGFWEYSIGDIDQRPSPNLDWVGTYQRIEIGTDEYMEFCREVGAEPQLTVGFGNGTPEDAAAWVEYCNGDSLSKYGSLRAKNGHPKPYNVKLWEVGNEQYGAWEIGHTTAVKYAERYIEYCRAMKKVDNSITIMINGDTWGDNWNDTIIKIAHDYIDLFSLHYGMGYELNSSFSKDSINKILMFNSYFFNYYLSYLENKLSESGLNPLHKLAFTEWIQLYGGSAKQHSEECASLQSGLWNGMMFNEMLHHASTIQLVNKTFFQGVMQSGVNQSTGERIIYGDPSYHILKCFHEQMRKNVIKTKVESTVYDFNIWKNVPRLNAAATYSEDTIVYSLINPHQTDSMEVSLLLPFQLNNSEITITQVYSPNYTDANLPASPNKILPVTSKKPFTGKVVMPPHSFSLVLLPVHKTSSVEPPPDINSFYVSIQPNPVDNQMNIVIDTPNYSRISFQIFNSLGQIIYSTPSSFFSKGKTTIPIESSQFAAGSYYCKVTTPVGVVTNQFIIVH